MPTLKEKTQHLKMPPPRLDPVWKGPLVDGITFSLLSRFLACRERFRLLVIEGLKPADQFNHRMEYGNMWHVCEEALARGPRKDGKETWTDALRNYSVSLCKRYPMQQEQVQHWYEVCKVQFPIYVDWWSRHSDVKGRQPLFQEKVFDVAHYLPSGRTVRLRGKWDSVDLINGGVWLQENKSKSDINEVQIRRQLTFDLQTMLYLVSMRGAGNILDPVWKRYMGKIKGVRYNVVRRPLSGGKGTITRYKAKEIKKKGIVQKIIPEESKTEYYARLAAIISGSPQEYFMRWNCEVAAAEIDKFQRECLDPILEQLCDWWEWVSCAKDPFDQAEHSFDERKSHLIHWRTPYGHYNPMADGNASDLDEHLATGSTAGLQHCDNLFPEL